MTRYFIFTASMLCMLSAATAVADRQTKAKPLCTFSPFSGSDRGPVDRPGDRLPEYRRATRQDRASPVSPRGTVSRRKGRLRL